MIFKRYDKRIVQANGGYRLKLYFKSDDGHRCTLASPMLLNKNIKTKEIENWNSYQTNFSPIYTDEFKAEMNEHAKRIVDIKELGK